MCAVGHTRIGIGRIIRIRRVSTIVQVVEVCGDSRAARIPVAGGRLVAVGWEGVGGDGRLVGGRVAILSDAGWWIRRVPHARL